MTQLCAQDISHAFGQTAVLRDVCVTLDAGESVAIIGPNGVGKTTLVRILAGLLEPTAGRVTLGGDTEADGRLQDLGRPDIARVMSVIAQARPHIFDFSALEVVLMGFHARSGRFSLASSTQRSAAVDAMARLGVDALADRPASVLSGGEFQRVIMARTLVAGTDIWLLDEPTASLDLRHQVAVLDCVADHCAAGGSAAAVLHDLALAERYFERVIVLDDARVVADGPTDATLTDALLSEVFEVRLRGGHVGGRKVWVVP